MPNVDLKLTGATHQSAKYACLNWHYSKCMPIGKLVKIGVYENSKFIGVVIFGRGACGHLGSFINLKQTEVCELNRIALYKHETPVSKIVSIALKILKKLNPKMKLVVSYSDANQGHHGGIYQAGNWIYVGQGGNPTFYMINGKLTHPRNLGLTAFDLDNKREFRFKGLSIIERAKLDDPLAYAVKVKGKHKYFMPLDKNIKNDILKLSKPYPKRVKQAMNDDQS
tara:strand:+ start:1004 stop:1678 length:675 start_codon:yes stop_codon:yes gene_type:complete